MHNSREDNDKDGITNGAALIFFSSPEVCFYKFISKDCIIIEAVK